MKLPTITLKRLILRPFNLDDAKLVQEYAGNKDVAKTTLNIPYPYEDGMAEQWISTHLEEYNKGNSIVLAITHKEDNYFIGAISIMINKRFDRGELGYWIGKQYWGNGYCTEAAKGIVEFGFNNMNLNKIFASHLKKNPASGCVMKKINMKYEGLLKQHVKKWDNYEDIVCYGLTKNEFLEL